MFLRPASILNSVNRSQTNTKSFQWADDDEDEIRPPPTEPHTTSNSVEETKQIENLKGSELAASANNDHEIIDESDSESAGIESRVSSLNTEHEEDVVNEQKRNNADCENKVGFTFPEKSLQLSFNPFQNLLGELGLIAQI